MPPRQGDPTGLSGLIDFNNSNKAVHMAQLWPGSDLTAPPRLLYITFCPVAGLNDPTETLEAHDTPVHHTRINAMPDPSFLVCHHSGRCGCFGG